MSLFFFDKTKGWCNMKNRIIIFALFVSQFLAGCIAFIPPSHRSETVVIIEYPDPVPVEPPYYNPVEPPLHHRIQSQTNQLKNAHIKTMTVIKRVKDVTP